MHSLDISIDLKYCWVFLHLKKKDWYLFGILIFATLSQICYKPSISKILTFSLTILCQFIM